MTQSPLRLPDYQADVATLLREPVAFLRENRTMLGQESARRITEAHLLTEIAEEEIFVEATQVYDNYVEASRLLAYKVERLGDSPTTEA